MRWLTPFRAIATVFAATTVLGAPCSWATPVFTRPTSPYDSFVDNKIYVVQGTSFRLNLESLVQTVTLGQTPLDARIAFSTSETFRSRSPLLSITEIPPQPRLSQLVPWRGRSFPVLTTFPSSTRQKLF